MQGSSRTGKAAIRYAEKVVLHDSCGEFMTPDRHWIAGLLAALIGLAVAAPSVAQSGRNDRSAAAVQVDGVDVEQVAQLAPGTALHFTVFGTPGAAAMLRIDGARSLLDLQERESGVYEGSYRIEARDRIRADSRVTATLQRGGDAAHASLEESLQLAQGDPSALDPAAAPPPMAPARRVERSERSVPVVVAPAATLPVSRIVAPDSICADCAVVESIRAPQGGAGPGNLGAVSGALIGAVLGEGAREAHMRRIARIHGTVTGALTGRRGDRDGSARGRYEVVFRFSSGAAQTHTFASEPVFEVGDAVRLDASGPRQVQPVVRRH